MRQKIVLILKSHKTYFIKITALITKDSVNFKELQILFVTL